jgi:hypothetical protein
MEDYVGHNYFTKPDRRPPKSRDKGEIDDILAKFGKEFPYVQMADVCGVKIQLRTNSKHVLKYWNLNWFPAVDGEVADGIIYVVNGIDGYEPHQFYDLERRRLLIVNSEYYGTVKSAGVLGLTGVIAEERDVHPIHGACVGIEKNGNMEGCVIIAPTGTGKTSQSHELLYSLPNSKVHSDDYVFVFFEPEPIAKATERQLYMRTDIAKNHRTFIPLFDKLPIENVVMEKRECAKRQKDQPRSCYNMVLRGERSCEFDNGRKLCYWAYGNSRVMFPRYMFPMLIREPDGGLREVPKGKESVINEVPVNYIVLLTRDRESVPARLLNCEEVIEVLKEGRFTIRPGAGPPEKWGKIGYEPFYNPYPPEINLERQEKFFRRLYDSGVKFYLLNTGHHKNRKITLHQTHMYIRHIIGV